MATVEDGQKALYSSIALALQSSLSAEEAASQVFETGSWTQLQPDYRNHAIISCCLKKHLLDFLESRLSASASVFNTAPGDNGRTGARTLLVLLKVRRSQSCKSCYTIPSIHQLPCIELIPSQPDDYLCLREELLSAAAMAAQLA